jgi:hypothetical protein
MMKKLLQITLGFQLMLSIAQAQCSGSELSGSTTISFPVEERMLTFNIYHGFFFNTGNGNTTRCKSV